MNPKLGFFSAFCVLVIASLACAGGTSTPAANEPLLPASLPSETAMPGEPTATAVPPTLAATDTPLPPTETPDPNHIVAGTYLVGTEIKPGLYRGLAGQDILESCYWERLKGLSGSFDDILANGDANGQFYLEVKADDTALKTDCALTFLPTLPAPPAEFPQTIPPGIYLVNVDIQPGTYKGQAGEDILESCYWERLSSVAGGFEAILANGDDNGQFYVQVAPTDFALKTGCELTRTGD